MKNPEMNITPKEAANKAQLAIDGAVELRETTGIRVVGIGASLDGPLLYLFNPSNNQVKKLARKEGIPVARLDCRKPNNKTLHTTILAPGVTAELVLTSEGLQPTINGVPVPFGSKISRALGEK